MRRKPLFKSSFLPTEEFYREFNQTWRFKIRIVYFIFIIVFSVFVLLGISSKRYTFAFEMSVYELVLMVVVLFTDHYDRNFKRLKVQYNNEIPLMETMFNDDNIVLQAGKNKQEYGYNLIKDIIDGDNLMILKLGYNLGIIVNKNSMDKKEVNKLKKFLLEKSNVTRIPIVPSKIHVLKFIAWICSILGFCVSLILFITK